MRKKVVVISLGGSQIIQNSKVNVDFLKKFKKVLKDNSRNYKFVVVCGGGEIARIYIKGLKQIGTNEKMQNYAGISVTRTNARFLSYFFGKDSKQGIPHKISNVLKLIKKNNIVFCGGLEYHPNQTSDSTAANIASELKCDFINITNVQGLYTSDPKKNKTSKLISKISWKEFHKKAMKIKFKPGQHFVLDQSASKIILDHKINTYIVGDNLSNLNNILKNKSFKGTIISE